MLKGQPAVLIAELPPQENDQFQLVPYGLYALRRGYNNGLRFNKLPRAAGEPARRRRRATA